MPIAKWQTLICLSGDGLIMDSKQYEEYVADVVRNLSISKSASYIGIEDTQAFVNRAAMKLILLAKFG